MLKLHFKARTELAEWLQGKPADWGSAIATRAAMRSLPYLNHAQPAWLEEFALQPLRALIFSWVAVSTPKILDGTDAAKRAASAVNKVLSKRKSSGSLSSELAADATYLAALDAESGRSHNAVQAVKSSAEAAANFVHMEHNNIDDWEFIDDFPNDPAGQVMKSMWDAVSRDCEWLFAQNNHLSAARRLSYKKIWSDDNSDKWVPDWGHLETQLLSIDENYWVWTSWFERRIRGDRAAFDIPGDRHRIENKKILRRLAEATDEDFWGKGHEYVNATLKGWLDEARARVAPPIPEVEADIRVPSQEPHAIAYGVNNDGMIDRLPSSNQKHLRDSPEQHRGYVDIREAADTLFDENQRLGPRLYAAIERFRASLPESFEEAETYLVWRDGNALRRLYLAHRKVEARNEPDEARLEAVVAEMLGGLLDLYNVFAFADDGLRAKDEDRITLQERADGKAEASASAPIMRAIFDNPAITSDAVRQDIQVEVENSDLPVGDPYSDQALDQSNRINRNLVAGILQWMSENLGNPTTFPGAVAVTVTSGAVAAGGSALLGAASGINFFPLLEFVAAQASDLHSYVSIAYPSYPHLTELIAQAKHLWQRITGKV